MPNGHKGPTQSDHHDCHHAGEYDYNLLVVGGGSAGLGVAKEAAILGQKVLLLDFMTLSPKGSTWNVSSCGVSVLKKLMHQAASIGQTLKDSAAYGWRLQHPVSHSWPELTDALQQRVKALSFELRHELRKRGITYMHAHAALLDPHTVQATDAKGDQTSHTAETIVVTTGDRPHYPDLPGAKEHCITCDDLFSLPYSPGRTLVVGGTGEALEAAGWLFGLGLDVSVMPQSSVPDGYDQKVVRKIEDHMYVQGVNFLYGSMLTKVEQIEAGSPGKLRVTAHSPELGDIHVEDFSTVLLAVGRDACTHNIGLERAGVQVDQRTGKIVVSDEDRTSVSHIYAIGAVQDGRLAHSGLSMQAGRLLAQRLYGGKNTKSDYSSVPTVLFTPMEYAACGLTEETACQRFGETSIEVFHSNYWPQEWTLPRRNKNSCYAKVICHISDNHRVLGVHILGPSAGEIIQGFATALRCALTKEQLDATVGLHPVCAEVLTNLTLTQRETEAMLVQGNC
ncbi:hypothetical protein AALO_G00227570 [Alosa alosa]|uniref:Thioredoxin reductase 1, cytoplasmic n=1 Tax=Alosa alosa TaxID=278164 RepID=A0AAV6G1Y3_9TELE|nr:thioredoxin reductase 1, cytoplasmic-like [Alosa alosa]KAG5267931.1 hypothetical protein AALO_G00227570 [Alosa alosa]